MGIIRNLRPFRSDYEFGLLPLILVEQGFECATSSNTHGAG